jgi:serine/threonine-protein kinase RsbW
LHRASCNERLLNGIAENIEMMRKTDQQTIEVNLPNTPGYERIAMECSASFAKLVGFVQERVEDLKTAVSEACLNAIEHGNRGRPEARVIVTMSFDEDTLSVSVKDEGVGVSELPKAPDIEGRIENLEPPRGLGIYLIKQLVDHVEFNQMTKDGHVVRMAMKMTR